MHHSIQKIIFVLGADEYLERLEGKIRKRLFFYNTIFQNNSVRAKQRKRGGKNAFYLSFHVDLPLFR